ncbi:hypothetical protein PS1_015967 [Malus domestica]
MGAISCLDPVKALFGRFLGFCRNEQSSSLELPYVPFDIINEILSWLPVESLLRFKFGHPQVARIRNPATRQVLCLPDAHKDTYDLSFDLYSSSGECKVVCTYIIEKQNYFGTGVGFEVLTVGKDEQWRPLKNPKQNLPEQGDEGLMLELRFVHQSDEAIHDNVLSVLVLEDYKQQIWSENKIIIPLKFLKDDSHLEDKIILSCIWFKAAFGLIRSDFITVKGNNVFGMIWIRRIRMLLNCHGMLRNL